MLTTSPTPEGLLDDGGGVLGPDEGCGVSIPRREIALDVADERADGLEGPAPHGLAREDAEPRLDQVEPGGALRGEMELHPRMGGEPRLHRRRRMRGRVVQDDVELVAAVPADQTFEEGQKVGAGVPVAALAHDRAAGDFEGGI